MRLTPRTTSPTEHDACRDLHRACAWVIATVGAVGMDRPIAEWTWRSHNRPKAAHSYEFALLMPDPFVDELRRFILTYAEHDRDCPGLDANALIWTNKVCRGQMKSVEPGLRKVRRNTCSGASLQCPSSAASGQSSPLVSQHQSGHHSGPPADTECPVMSPHDPPRPRAPRSFKRGKACP